jgi:hypothetical protein
MGWGIGYDVRPRGSEIFDTEIFLLDPLAGKGRIF